jgi:hypothetical protein
MASVRPDEMRGLRPEEARENRIRALSRFIIEFQNGKCPIREVYRFACRNWGYRFRKATIDDYIRILLMSGEFTINDEHIVYIGKAKKSEEKE